MRETLRAVALSYFEGRYPLGHCSLTSRFQEFSSRSRLVDMELPVWQHCSTRGYWMQGLLFIYSFSAAWPAKQILHPITID